MEINNLSGAGSHEWVQCEGFDSRHISFAITDERPGG